MTRLAQANALLLALFVGHGLDHAFNQPPDPAGSAPIVGFGGLVIVAISLGLALARLPLAPVASAYVGAITAIGIVAIHLLPGWWSFVSDSFWDFDANAVSWAIVLANLVAALWLLALGVGELRARRTFAEAR